MQEMPTKLFRRAIGKELSCPLVPFPSPGRLPPTPAFALLRSPGLWSQDWGDAVSVPAEIPGRSDHPPPNKHSCPSGFQ